MAKVQTITNQFIEMDEITSFSIMGDPGCDGLGAEILSVYEKALDGSQGQFSVVIGDLVPKGEERFYAQTNKLIEQTAKAPVYMMRGNHDTGEYEKKYGPADYAIFDSRLLLVMLDDSKRCFAEKGLEVLRRALNEYARDHVVIMMHIPPPNDRCGNHVSPEEWKKVKEIIDASPCAGRVDCLIAGHVHSYFETETDGMSLVVTGGAGARPEEVETVAVMPPNHYVEFRFDGSVLTHERVDISAAVRPMENGRLRGMISGAFAGECMTYVRYLIYSREAAEKGMKNLAEMFAAFAEAEFIHAENLYAVSGRMGSLEEAVSESLENELAESREIYPASAAYAAESGEGLAEAAFDDAAKAEEKHAEILAAAKVALQEGSADIAAETYYTCVSCGKTMTGPDKPKRCPVCGAPADRIIPLSF